MTKGLVFGKFMPPTMGHKSMIDIARRTVDRLFVFVGDVYEDNLVPRGLRARWLRMHYGDAIHVVAPDQDALAQEISSDELLKRWRTLVLDLIGGPPDRLFGSEPYLAHIAASLGAEFILIDEHRNTVPISASQVRADPIGNWDMILPEARGAFRREVVVVAPQGEVPSIGPGVDVRDLRDLRSPHPASGIAGRPSKLLITLVSPDQVTTIRRPVAPIRDPEWRWFAEPAPIVAVRPDGANVAPPLMADGVTILSPIAFADFIERRLGSSPPQRDG